MTTLDITAALEALQRGSLDLEGQLLWGSNYTFLLQVEYQDTALAAVYKPTQGERPLWDFPAATLARREVAAYLVDEALGWQLVPPTVFREDGPAGPGSLQLFVEHDPEYHYFNFSPQDVARLRPVAAFDALINNADRKGGHVLVDPGGHIWGIDHGVSFHVHPKLRTVIWDFSSEPLPPEIGRDVAHFAEHLRDDPDLTAALSPYLSPREITALVQRAESLLATGCFPAPPENTRAYPWPPI